jgi:predicted outer membrane protein
MRKNGTALLRRQPPKTKDPDETFYQAQLVLYGLEKKENREAAKKVLLEAYEANGGVMRVPLHIKNIEAQVKSQWEVTYAEEMKQHQERRREREAIEKAEREVQEKRWAERAKLAAAR